jgi:chromosomal replication initiator protein
MITVEKAIEVACNVSAIPVEQFASKERIEENADARSIAYKLLKDINMWGGSRIARIWDKDHSSILWAIKRVDNSLYNKGSLGKLYKEAKKQAKQ